MHVQLLVKLPEASTTGKQIENRVELVDVTPTLLQEAGIAIPPEMQGASLLPLMKVGKAAGNSESESWHDRPAYSQSEYPHHFGWSALRALRSETYLSVQAPRGELYDETADPNAEHNLASSAKAVSNTLGSQLETLRRKTSNTR